MLQDSLKFLRSIEKVQEYEMTSNGLRVLLLEDRSVPVATLMVTYFVGARNEKPGHTGGSHMLEHMLFKGSEKFRKEEGRSISQVLQPIGAVMNATTSMDVTNFYETLPSEWLPLAMDIEADRMRGALLRQEDFQSERDVVLSEFESVENSPMNMLVKAVWKQAFPGHGYGTLPIGLREDVENMTVEQLRTFYNTYYWPNNAVLSVIGDFDKEETLERIREKFGAIPRSPEPIPVPEKGLGFRASEKPIVVEQRDDLSAVMLAYAVPEGRHPDVYALDVLSQILSGGKTARFYRQIVDTELAVQVASTNSIYYDPGLFTIAAYLSPSGSRETVQKTLLSCIEDLKTGGIRGEEIETAKAQIRSQAAFQWDGQFKITGALNEAIGIGDWPAFAEMRKRIDAVTLSDVERVLRDYLLPDKVITAYLVAAASESPAAAGAYEAPGHDRQKPEAGPAADLEHFSVDKSTEQTQFVDKAQLHQAGPVRLITLKTKIRDVVALSGSFLGGGDAYSKNPLLASVTAGMLEMGTQKFDKYAIAELLESRGIDLNFEAGSERVEFKASLLKQDLPTAVGLIAEQLRNPVFPEEELKKIKTQLDTTLRHQMTDTEIIAMGEFARQVYPAGHINYEHTLQEQLEALHAISAEGLRRFHRDHYGPQDMVVVAVGDIDAQELAKSVEKAFAGWPVKSGALEVPRTAALRPAAKKIVPVPEKRNLDVYFGHGLPLKYGQREYFAMSFASFILGGDFIARLSNRVRDEKGLTYSIYSTLDGATDETEGHWDVHMITTPRLLDQAISETSSVIGDYALNGATAQEFKRMKTTIAGKYKVSLGTTRALAGQIRRVEEMGQGYGFVDEFPRIIESLTLDEVNEAVRKNIQPEKLQIVIAGDADKT